MFRRLLFLFVVGIFGMILSLPYAEYAICGAVLMWLFLLPQARYNLWISILTIKHQYHDICRYEFQLIFN